MTKGPTMNHDHTTNASAGLPSADLPGDDFELLLRKQLQHNQPYLADEDFTAGVMAKLPAPRRLSRLQERLILLVPLAIISLLVLSQFSLLSSGLKIWYGLLALDVASFMQLGVLLAISVVTAACYWIAKQIRLI